MATYRRMLILLGTVLLLSVLTISGSFAQEAQDLRGLYEDVFGKDTQPLEMSEVPITIRHAAMAAVSDVKATEAGVEIAPDGTLLYVLDFQNAQGREISVDVNSTGRIVSVEHSLTMDELPREIGDTVKRWAPYLEPTLIEKSVRADGVVYELEGIDAQGNEVLVQIPNDQLSLTIWYHHPIIIRPPIIVEPPVAIEPPQ